ncbi:hypothetical protein LV716_00605 [Flagellimonas sp. HMM57]|uniref:hypothetical protein n=1 Tax=unclassified Flagellimonas TaxID=2644544 RepID=UPI0013D63E13|nr:MULTISPECIES: hypothetical protein [unclassified Flagellimonas]UII76326.1 hypothetical protein LV716_00605 [Flagellimonas sp. HMM57]
MIKNILTIILLFLFTALFAQETVIIPHFLQNPMDSIKKQNFNQSLESLLSEITKGKINESLLTPKRVELTQSLLQELVNYEKKKDSSALKFKDKQLINVYPISNGEYFVSISYTSYKEPESDPVLLYIIDLIATKIDDKFTFSVPIDYLTRYWKTQTIGNITYHYKSDINIKRAELFNKKILK